MSREKLKQLAEKNANLATVLTGVLDEEVGPLRTDLDEVKSKMSGEVKQYIERLETDMKEQNKTIKALQALVNRPGQVGGFDSPEEKAKAGRTAFEKALRYGWGSLDAEQKKLVKQDSAFGLGSDEKIGHGQAAEHKTMFGSDATTGGFLMTPEIAKELIAAVVEISDFHSLVNVRMTGNPWVILRKRTQTTSAARTAEQATRTETQNMKFGRIQVFPYTAYALTKISNEDLQDTELDLASYVMTDFSEEFSRLEGWEIPNGLGAGAYQCKGFLNETDVTGTAYTAGSHGAGYIESSTSGGYTYPDLIDLRHALKPAYRKGARWGFTTETLADLAKLTDSQNRPLLFEANGMPSSTLLGYPYTEMVDLQQAAAGTFPIWFGDWKRFYTLVIRSQVSVQVIDQRWIDEDAIGYMAKYRFGGNVTLPEACHPLKIKA